MFKGLDLEEIEEAEKNQMEKRLCVDMDQIKDYLKVRNPYSNKQDRGSFSISAVVNILYPFSYEPAVVLCIPLLPGGFFVAVFSVFCVILTIIVFGFLIAMTYLKKVNLDNEIS